MTSMGVLLRSVSKLVQTAALAVSLVARGSACILCDSFGIETTGGYIYEALASNVPVLACFQACCCAVH